MATRIKSAERLIRRAVDRGMLQSYPVNNRTRVHMLTALGVEHIDKMGVGNHTEEACDWIAKIRNAKKKGKVWRVPQYFDHHCRALRYLGWASHVYFVEVLTEAEILRLNPHLRAAKGDKGNPKKCPDGLLLDHAGQTWIEVEGARKTPADMKSMAETAIRIIWGVGPKIQIGKGIPSNISSIDFVIPPPGLDTRKVALNHPKRIENALKGYELPPAKRIESRYTVATETATGFTVEVVRMDPKQEGRIDRVGGVKYPVLE